VTNPLTKDKIEVSKNAGIRRNVPHQSATMEARILKTPPSREAEIKRMESLAAPHTITQRGNVT
jgi:hypothetical protein